MATAEEIASALKHVHGYDHRPTYTAIGMAIQSELGDAGLPLFLGWARPSKKYDEKTALYDWNHFSADGGITIKTLFKYAREGGWEGPQLNGNGTGQQSGVTLAQLADAKKLPVDFLMQHGVRDAIGKFGNAVVEFQYFQIGGCAAPRYRIRVALSAPPGKKRFIWNTGEGKIVAYLNRLDAGTGGDLWLVEGESDSLTGWYHEKHIVGIPGASMGKCLQPSHIKAYKPNRVIVSQEPGDGGVTFRTAMLKRIRLCGHAGPILIVHWPEGIKDISGLHIKYANESGAFERELATLVEQAEVDPGTEGTGADGSNDRGGQATALVNLAMERCRFFHDSDDEGYAIVTVDGHEETHNLRSRGFRRWLSHTYFKSEHGRAPNSDSISAALNTLEGRSVFESHEQEVSLRVAECDGCIYIDIADKRWQVIRVSRDGWDVIEAKQAPVNFRRTRGMLPLPMPERGGSIQQLREFFNLAEAPDQPRDFILIVSWLVSAFSERGPFPILILHGEQDSAKSTLSKIARALIDPRGYEYERAVPRDLHDFAIAAHNSWVLFFGNLSYLSSDFSDAFCRLSTGGAFATRTLYENREEEVLEAVRPTILNGIEEIATRGDLLDRSIVLNLQTIAEKERRDEREFYAAFETAQPKILGALLDGVAAALRNRDSVKLTRRPRMYDFAKWASAAMPAFGWKADDFIEAYMDNREHSNAITLEASILAPYMRTLAAQGWTGTATELLARLNEDADKSTKRKKNWPNSPNVLSNRLNRIAPNLRTAGIEVKSQRGSESRKITIGKIEPGKRSVEDIEIDRLARADAAKDDEVPF